MTASTFLQDDDDWNLSCRYCDAKLFVTRVAAPSGPGETASCPYCRHDVPPRDAGDLLHYRLVRPPDT